MHRQARANCTDATLYFWMIFQFFLLSEWDLDPPTHFHLFWYFWNFLTLQSPKGIDYLMIVYMIVVLGSSNRIDKNVVKAGLHLWTLDIPRTRCPLSSNGGLARMNLA